MTDYFSIAKEDSSWFVFAFFYFMFMFIVPHASYFFRFMIIHIKNLLPKKRKTSRRVKNQKTALKEKTGDSDSGQLNIIIKK